MQKVIKIIKKMYWMGCIGIVGTILNIKLLELFYLFFLLAILDFILSLILVLKCDDDMQEVKDLKFLFQNIGMLIGIPIIYLINLFRLPNVYNHKTVNGYILPFNGRWLVANGGIDKENSHSWGICNQRYAYDFVIERNGKSYSNNRTSVTDYFCYNQPVIAPADGIVVEIKNSFEDTPISNKVEVQCSASDIRGNYIVIKHTSNEYSTIAHLKKDSFIVSVRDFIKQGQQIASCGNSGNTSEPHIHFQIQQGKSFLFSASLPIYFDNIINCTEDTDVHYITGGQTVENQKKYITVDLKVN
ncbi:M23 family metallopeptidase [Clostridioides sp. ZZV14-6105]|uniref:M23 family metallopeptidase n=1 Tax=Clostridioides sp. ZZV14-6105 TaxID=2811492 RepID=UPI001D12C54A|nr:M23 family metallopeptidase [Clostridioides sp. ZZV14-6105]